MILRLFILTFLALSLSAQQPKTTTPVSADSQVLWQFDTGG